MRHLFLISVDQKFPCAMLFCFFTISSPPRTVQRSVVTTSLISRDKRWPLRRCAERGYIADSRLHSRPDIPLDIVLSFPSCPTSVRLPATFSLFDSLFFRFVSPFFALRFACRHDIRTSLFLAVENPLLPRLSPMTLGQLLFFTIHPPGMNPSRFFLCFG